MSANRTSVAPPRGQFWPWTSCGGPTARRLLAPLWVSPDAFSHFVILGIKYCSLEHRVDKLISYILHYTSDVVFFHEVWVDFPLECLLGLSYRAVVSTPFCGDGLVVLIPLSRFPGGWGGVIHTWSSKHALGACAYRGTSTSISIVHLFAPQPFPRRSLGCLRCGGTLSPRLSSHTSGLARGPQRLHSPPWQGWLATELQSGAWQFLSCPHDERSPSNLVRMRREGGSWHVSETLTDWVFLAAVLTRYSASVSSRLGLARI